MSYWELMMCEWKLDYRDSKVELSQEYASLWVYKICWCCHNENNYAVSSKAGGVVIMNTTIMQ